jgi:predicted transcriptional regulator
LTSIFSKACRRLQKVFKGCFVNYTMFGWIFGKKEAETIKEDTKKGFESVKKDISSVSGWIKHLDSEKNLQQKEISDIKNILSSMQEDMDGLKNIVSMMNGLTPNKAFKTPKRLLDKQTAVYAVQTGVQTGVQTPNLSQFSVTERAILWILLNSDMKLGYDDISAILGKEKSTIRGQINKIRSKSEGIVEESIEKNGKKRVYIPEEMKEKMLKKQKVRVNESKKHEKEV